MNDSNFIEENFLPEKNKTIPFLVPPNYFTSLDKIIIDKILLSQEINEFKVLNSLKKETPFIIPENYFHEIKNSIHNLNEIEEKNIAIKNKLEYQSELSEFKILSEIEIQNCFQIDGSYFDLISDVLKDKIKNKTNERIEIVKVLESYFNKPKLALAMAATLILGVSAVVYFNRSSEISVENCKTLACLERNELLNENNIRDIDDENLFDAIDENKIDELLNKSAVSDSIKFKIK